MPTIKVKNLGKYQPGYTDRKHKWAKIYFESFLDDEFQKLHEIDRYRFWSLIVYETYLEGKPVVLNDTNLKLLGWSSKKRAISLTLQMLHTLVIVCNGQSESSVTQSRVDKSRVEKKREEYTCEFLEFWKKFKGRWDIDKGYIKVGKKEAFDEFKKLPPEQQQKAIDKAHKSGGKATPDACRWLKNWRFDD